MMPIAKLTVFSNLFRSIFLLFFLANWINQTKAQCNLGVTLIHTPDPICYGQMGTFQAITTGGTPPLAYSWYSPSNFPMGFPNDSTMNITPFGAYTVTVVVTDDNGCTSSATFTSKPPLTHVEVVYEAVCVPPDDYQYELSVLYPTGTIEWSTGETTTQIIGQPGFPYSVTITHPNGCTKSIDVPSLPILQSASPVFDLTGPTDLCENVDATLNATNLGFWSFAWSTGEQGWNNQININGPGTYTVTVTSPNLPCPAVDSIVIVPTPPIPPLINVLDDNVCPGELGTIEVVNSSVYQQFNWSIGLTTPVVNVEGGYDYFVTVTEPNGCTSVDMGSVGLYTVIDPIVAAMPDICVGQEEWEWQVVPPIYSQYAWSTGETTQKIIVADPGTYSLTVTDINGCVFTTEQTLEEAPMPSPSIPPIAAACNGSPQQLTVEGGPYQTYLWSSGSTAASIQANQGGTYTVTVTNTRGCSASASTTVTVGTAPTASISTAPPNCDGNATLTASGGSTYLWSTGATTPSITTNTNGSYTVTVTAAGGCTATAAQSVSTTTPPQVLITGPSSFCSGTTANLQASTGFSSYAWSNGATTSFASVAQAGTYTVTATNAAGCTVTNSIVVDVYASPTATINGPTSFCTNTSAVLSLSGNYSTAIWSNGASTPSISVSQAGTYAVTVSNGQGCTATASQSVSVSNSLSFDIVETMAVCDGTAQLDAGSGYASYMWSNGANTPTINVTQSVNYSVTVSDGTGCTGEANTAVSFPALPVASVIGTNLACAGETVVMGASQGFTNYLWNNGETTPNISVLQSGDYWVTVTDVNGCTATAGQQVFFSPLPTLAMAGPASICTGNTAVFEVTGDFSQVLWSTGEQTPIINVSQPGNYTVVVMNGNGCTASATHNLNVSTSLLPSISETAQPCVASANLDAGIGYANYLWSNGQTSHSISVQQAGNYSVTVSDASGCTGEAAALVNFANAPQVDIIGTPSICVGSSAVYAVSGNFPQINWSTGEQSSGIIVSQAGNYSVTVTDSNGCTASATQAISVSTSLLPEIVSSNLSCNGTATLDAGTGLYTSYWWSNGETSSTINVNQAGNYGVTVSDGSGCTGETAHVVSFPAPPLVQVLGPTAVCAGTNAVLSLSGNFASVIWSNGSTAPSIGVSQADNYAVTVTDANGCTAANTLALSVNPSPLPDIAPTNLGCNGTGTLTAGGGFSSYLWSNGASSPSINITQSGNYVVTVTDGSGCTGTDQLSISLNLPPQVNIIGSGQLCEGYSTTLSAPGNFAQYGWSTGEATPSISISLGGQYGLTVTDANGCTATAAWTVAQLPTQYAFVQQTSCSLQDTGTVAIIFTSYQGCDSVVTVTTALSPSLTSILSLSACPGEMATFNGTGILAGTTQDFLFASALGCDSVVTVAVSEFPAVELDWQTKPSCWNSSDGSVTLTVMEGTPPYRFSLDGGNLQSSAIFEDLSIGDHNALVVDKNDCRFEVHVEIPATPIMTIQLENGEIPCGVGFVKLSPTLLSGDPLSIDWRWSTGEQTQDLIVTNPGNFFLSADDGCEVQSFSATVMPAADWDKSYFYVPNSFSPNGDGTNDYFMPIAGDGVEVRQFEFRVFDRWGNTMYSTTDHLQLGWDGRHKLSMMQNAVFVWYLKATVADCMGKDLKLFKEGGVNAVR